MINAVVDYFNIPVAQAIETHPFLFAVGMIISIFFGVVLGGVLGAVISKLIIRFLEWLGIW